MKLDVGCGVNWHGDINIDLYVEATKHDRKREKLPIHSIPNFIVSDAQKLPFKEAIFDEVVCFHVLEHVKNPFEVLMEVRRVMKYEGKLRIEVPNANRFLEKSNEMHLYTWNEFTLKNLLGKSGFKVRKIGVYGKAPFPLMNKYSPAINRFLTFLLPHRPPTRLRIQAIKIN